MNQTTPAVHTANSESLPELIRAREATLERLLLVSERQLRIVQEGNVSLLLQLLGHKQKLFGEFERIERKLDPHRNIPPEARRWSSEAERKEAEIAIAHCDQLLAEILRFDEQSVQVMSSQKSMVADQIRRVRQGSRLHAAYAKQNRGSGTVSRSSEIVGPSLSEARSLTSKNPGPRTPRSES